MKYPTEYLIVANGPFLAQSILLEIAKNKIIMALDGATDSLVHLNIDPDIILGDFDSIKQKINAYQYKDNIQIIHAPDQNYTDLQKALQYLNNPMYINMNSIKAIHIVCATGGRMDHEQANLRLLQEYYHPERPIFLHTEYQSLFFVRDQKNILISGQEQDYCGFFGMPYAIMEVHYGLAYGNKNEYELFLGHDSVANKIIGVQGACINIAGEALIVHPPMFASQRAFFSK